MVSDDDDVLYRAPVGANKRTMRLRKQGAQWANLGPHVVKLNQYRYLMYFQPNFHVGILYEHCVCIFCICGFVFL